MGNDCGWTSRVDCKAGGSSRLSSAPPLSVLTTAPFRGPDAPSPDDLANCVHCGLCLATCPTYMELGQEMESPRGRLWLIRAVQEGRTPPTERLASHLFLCLDCRACESYCPSGVKFGRIMEAARGEWRRFRPGTPLQRLVRRLVFRELFPHPRRLRALATALRLYQLSGLRAAVQRSGLLELLPGRLATLEASMPDLRRPFFAPASVYPALGERPASGGRVAYFAGCVMGLAFPNAGAATIRVLQLTGWEVVAPADQLCCGALNVHSGERDSGRELARANIRAFEALGRGVDEGELPLIVSNAAGCGAMLKEYGELLEQDPEYAERARRFSARVRDISELLDELPLPAGLGPLPLKVTYQDACHLAHGQGIRRQPRRLLEAIPGLELVEMREPDRCCGSAGIYNLTQPEVSAQVLRTKLAAIAATGADVVVANNPGCLLQLQAGIRQHGLPMRAAHLVELLDEAWERGEPAAASRLPGP